MEAVSEITATEHGNFWHFEWLCEKWSEEAVQFARKRLEREGTTHIQDGFITEKRPIFNRDADGEFHYLGEDNFIVAPRLIPITHGITSEQLRRLVGEPEECEEIQYNLLLNEGIQRMLDLLIAAGGTAFNNANAYLGVGTSTTAEAATQTDLQTAAFYKGMNATYPSRTTQTVSWQSDFTTSEANQAWQEWSVSAGATTASGAGFTVGTTNLNRKVQSLGTKATGTWTLTGQVTIS